MASPHSQQRLLLMDAPPHNTFLELWTMVHFLIPGISRPYLHPPLKAPNEENQDYYHKVVIRLHRVRVGRGAGRVEVRPCRLGREATGALVSFPGDPALHPEEDQEGRGEAADEEVRARAQVPAVEPAEGPVRGRDPAARVSGPLAVGGVASAPCPSCSPLTGEACVGGALRPSSSVCDGPRGGSPPPAPWGTSGDRDAAPRLQRGSRWDSGGPSSHRWASGARFPLETVVRATSSGLQSYQACSEPSRDGPALPACLSCLVLESFKPERKREFLQPGTTS